MEQTILFCALGRGRVVVIGGGALLALLVLLVLLVLLLLLLLLGRRRRRLSAGAWCLVVLVRVVRHVLTLGLVLHDTNPKV